MAGCPRLLNSSNRDSGMKSNFLAQQGQVVAYDPKGHEANASQALGCVPSLWKLKALPDRLGEILH